MEDGLKSITPEVLAQVPMSVGTTDLPPRYRCTACGNLTRFDADVARVTTEFWHYGIDGNRTVEDVTSRSETITRVTCRWCNSSTAVVEITHEPSLNPK